MGSGLAGAVAQKLRRDGKCRQRLFALAGWRGCVKDMVAWKAGKPA